MSMTGMPASIIFCTGAVRVPIPKAWMATKSHFCDAMLSIGGPLLDGVELAVEPDHFDIEELAPELGRALALSAPGRLQACIGEGCAQGLLGPADLGGERTEVAESRQERTGAARRQRGRADEVAARSNLCILRHSVLPCFLFALPCKGARKCSHIRGRVARCRMRSARTLPAAPEPDRPPQGGWSRRPDARAGRPARPLDSGCPACAKKLPMPIDTGGER